jgi:hypothetical protein
MKAAPIEAEALPAVGASADRLPELWGTAEVAEELGVAVSNLGKVVGLPEPAVVLASGRSRPTRIWLASEIKAFARRRRRTARRKRGDG